MNRLAKFALAIAVAAYCAIATPLVTAAAVDPTAVYSVGVQYDTTHVYVPATEFDRLVASFVATFGGRTTPKGAFDITPTASETMSQLALTPSGTISVFGFMTPIPFPFGMEKMGYLVTDFDAAVEAAKADGAAILVAPFNDPIGRDAVIQWPGGVDMQLYWHTAPPNYPALRFHPENRIYISPDSADAFIRSFVAFTRGSIDVDDERAPGIEIGRPAETYRRVDITSGFGKMRVIVTDGHLPYPYGRELTGYEVANLGDALQKATSTGATTVVAPFTADGRRSAMLEFPGGYIAEVHQTMK